MANPTFQKPKGTVDILPIASQRLRTIERIAQLTFASFGYQEIRTPIFESYEVFSRSAGDTSDVVQKEMYDFFDKGERHLALRPEGTAGVVRAFVENKLYGPENNKPVKLYYMGPMFRYERPQLGRQRQFNQIGVEAFGSDSPILDAEVIGMVVQFFSSLGIKNLVVKINSLGDSQSRKDYQQALIDYLTPLKSQLSGESQQRLEKNPMRILDSKDAGDQEVTRNAPKLGDYLSDSSMERFKQVQKELEINSISFEIDESLVRGLDYYNHTIFEVQTTDKLLGSQATIAGGGRYEGLVEEFGGPQTPAIGFGIGVERLMSLLPAEELVNETAPMFYVATTSEKGLNIVSKIVSAIRNNKNSGYFSGLSVSRDYDNKSLKAQFKQADRLNAEYVITVGDEEIKNNQVKIKHLASGQEENADLSKVIDDVLQVTENLFDSQES